MAQWYSIKSSIRPNADIPCVVDIRWDYVIGYYHEDDGCFYIGGAKCIDEFIERFAIINEIQEQE